MIRIRNILVPVDFSECSRGAYEQACEYAEQFAAALHVLHVHPLNYQAEYGATGAEDECGVPDYRADAERRLDAFLGDTTGHCFPVVRTLVAGAPAKAICEHARWLEAEMVVMGTHSGNMVRKQVLGSVAEHVVRMAPCDVLVVHERPSKADRRGRQMSLAGSV